LAIFLLKSPYILETVRVGSWLLQIANRKSYVADRSVSAIDLEWPWKAERDWSSFILADLR